MIFIISCPIEAVGQEFNKNKRTFKIARPKSKPQEKTKKLTPKYNSLLIIEPIHYTLHPDTTKDVYGNYISDDSIQREYQQWLKHEPLRMRTPQMGYHYIQPDLKELNPNKEPALPKVGYHYDKRSVRPENQMVPPHQALITFDFAKIVSKEARNRARDIEHHKRAQKILDKY